MASSSNGGNNSNSPPYPLELSTSEFTLIQTLWGHYFDIQPYSDNDGKINVIACLKGFFFSPGGQQLVRRSCDLSQPSCIAVFDYGTFCDMLQVRPPTTYSARMGGLV